jgi:pimeloyl-ACP methyl ester carboxylesterase
MASALFIHSTATLPSMWDGVPPESVRGLDVIKPANLGYPPNPPLARGAPFLVEEEVGHVLAQVPDDDSPVHVVAHSYGGLVALKLLPLLGPRVATVYLFEPVIFGALPHSTHAARGGVEEVTAFRKHDWFLGDDTRGGSEEWIEMFIDYWNRPGSWSRMPEPLKKFTRSVGWKMFQEVRAVFDDGLRFEDHVVNARLTLIKARRSPAAARAVVDELARVNPRASVTDLADTGHLAPITHPELFARTIAAHFTPGRPARMR